jgi:CTP:phosphocholine cytidylyltransferase-like protein
MLFSYSGKWIIPILTISIIGYLIKKIVVKRKANNYWGNIFHSKITEYAVSINKTKNDGVGISEYKKYDDLLKKINNR